MSGTSIIAQIFVPLRYVGWLTLTPHIFSWPNIYILHVASCYQTFLEVNNKGADQTVP